MSFEALGQGVCILVVGGVKVEWVWEMGVDVVLQGIGDGKALTCSRASQPDILAIARTEPAATHARQVRPFSPPGGA